VRGEGKAYHPRRDLLVGILLTVCQKFCAMGQDGRKSSVTFRDQPRQQYYGLYV
jgi:hypothetical protein